MSGIDEARRTSFGAIATAYDRARPSYPEALVGDVIAHAGLRPGDKALEVGAGTGKATARFAAAGLRIDAIEPSAEMAEVGAANVPGARFIITTFEAAELEAAAYGLIFSAQAWHWVQPGRGERIAARALRPGGSLACFWNRVQWTACDLRDALDAAYASVGVTPEGSLMAPRQARLEFAENWRERIAATAGLEHPEARTYEWSQTYSTAQYIALLGTHSDHIVQDEARRTQLFGAIAGVIDGAGGSLELTYSTELCLARAAGT